MTTLQEITNQIGGTLIPSIRMETSKYMTKYKPVSKPTVMKFDIRHKDGNFYAVNPRPVKYNMI